MISQLSDRSRTMRHFKPVTNTKFTRLHASDGQEWANATGEATDLYRDGWPRYVLAGWPCSGRYMMTYHPRLAVAAPPSTAPVAAPAAAVTQ